MPAQLDAPRPAPAVRRGGAGFCLLCLPPISHFPVLFVSLALWVGIAATCWLSDSWADCPLTVPSPEQKSRRGSPSVCPHLLLLCLWKALALHKTLSASSGEARAAAVFKDCPALQLAAGRGWPGLAEACLGPLPLLLPAYRASSPVVFLEGPFTATSARVEA